MLRETQFWRHFWDQEHEFYRRQSGKVKPSQAAKAPGQLARRRPIRKLT